MKFIAPWFLRSKAQSSKQQPRVAVFRVIRSDSYKYRPPSPVGGDFMRFRVSQQIGHLEAKSIEFPAPDW